MTAQILAFAPKPPVRPQGAEPPPAPLTQWQRKFLKSLADWPLALVPEQRALLQWIARS
jgi:hypothetical protein